MLRLNEGRVRAEGNPDTPAGRNLKAWHTRNLWIDYPRSKSGEPMFIKIYPYVLTLLEKMKYSFIYTHAGKRINNKLIVPDLNDKLAFLSYENKENSKQHKQLFKTRSNKFKKLNAQGVQIKKARKTFEHFANELTDGNRTIVNKLLGQKVDKNALGDNHYSDYRTEHWINRLDGVHAQVLEKFIKEFCGV